MTLAYLDPASGSLIASALVGGVAAAGVAVKQARARFSVGFGRKRKNQSEFTADTGADVAADRDTAATDAGADDGAADEAAVGTDN